MSDTISLFPADHPVEGATQLGGSKSFMNRALILASLADSPSTLVNPSRSNDSLTLMNLLQRWGVEIEEENDDCLSVRRDLSLQPFTGELDVGPAGTVMRFITALAASEEGFDVVIKGSERMHERPIGPLVNALRDLGADISYLHREGFPPIQVRGKRLEGGAVKIAGDVSSQFLTALMLIGARLVNGLDLTPLGPLVSQSYLRMTVQALRSFGVKVHEKAEGGFVVQPGAIHGASYLVEGDASGASYLWGLAAISGGKISVAPFRADSLQGDVQFPTLLERMGCLITRDSESSSVEVRGVAGRLQPIEADMEEMPDTAQTLAVLAAIADGTSHLTGLQTLRIKETDRIQALQTELAKIGVKTDATDDSLTVHGVSPGELTSATIATYDDHRMAMSFALLGAVLPGLSVENPNVVSKSFPDFWEKLGSLGIKIS